MIRVWQPLLSVDDAQLWFPANVRNIIKRPAYSRASADNQEALSNHLPRSNKCTIKMDVADVVPNREAKLALNGALFALQTAKCYEPGSRKRCKKLRRSLSQSEGQSSNTSACRLAPVPSTTGTTRLSTEIMAAPRPKASRTDASASGQQQWPEYPDDSQSGGQCRGASHHWQYDSGGSSRLRIDRRSQSGSRRQEQGWGYYRQQQRSESCDYARVSQSTNCDPYDFWHGRSSRYGYSSSSN